MKVVTPAKMAELDQETIRQGTPSITLMERAGSAMTDLIETVLVTLEDEEFTGVDPNILVLCGYGNNGGDGLVIARLLRKKGYKVHVLFSGSKNEREQKMSKDSLENFQRLEGIDCLFAKDMDEQALRADIFKASLIVDALLGTGFDTARPLSGNLKELIELVNESPAFVVGVDIPSGLNGRTGNVGEDAVRCDLTITVQLPKTGELIGKGPDYTGELQIVDIGISTDDPEILYAMNDPKDLGFPFPRLKNSHKYSYGSLLVIAGSLGMTGAAALSADAAVHGGCGLVRALVEKSIYPIEAQIMPREAIVTPYDYIVSQELIEQQKKDVILFGPGIGRHMDYSGLIAALLDQPTPLIIDADGLWHLKSQLSLLKQSKTPVLLTPHTGEFAQLEGISTAKLMEDPMSYLTNFSEEFGVSVLLKGYHTMIASPDGKVYFNSTGNPGMATAGSGDVLAGLIGAIAAQTGNLLTAARAGAYYHGASGDWYAEKYGETTLSAGDLIDCLKYVLR